MNKQNQTKEESRSKTKKLDSSFQTLEEVRSKCFEAQNNFIQRQKLKSYFGVN